VVSRCSSPISDCVAPLNTGGPGPHLQYDQWPPNPDLAPFVQYYWSIRSDSRLLPALEHGVIPGGYVDLVFNLGDQIITGNSGGVFFDKARSFVAGPFDRFHALTVKGEFKSLGVRFHLGRAPLWDAFSVGELRNQAVPLDRI
jgi:Domain of unknown function (DUF6597)